MGDNSTDPNWTLLKKDTLRKRLGATDNIHDFYDESHKRVPSGPIGESVKTKLQDFLNTVVPKGRTVGDWLSTQYGGKVSPSSVEKQTIIWFETNFPLELRTNNRKTMTYRELLSQSYNNIDILDLDVGPLEDWDRDYTQTEKKQIGIKILNFFFPPGSNESLNSQNNTYITFDAGSNMPDNIFGNMDQVINLVTPLNITDSATTEVHLNGKNYYNHEGNSGNKYLFTSNIYTKGYYEINVSPTKPTYERSTRYDINLKIKKLGTPQKEITIKFDEKNKSGPSVAYLSDCIHRINNSTDKKPTPILKSGSTIVDIDSINGLYSPLDKENILKLFFDLKRGGDWEQANAAKLNNKTTGKCKNRTIFSTIDRLCGLYSRCIEQNTIYHVATRMILYRFPGADLSESEIRANKISFIKEKFAKLDNISRNITSLKTKLSNLIKSFDGEKISETIFKYKSSEDIQKILTYFARTLTTKSNIQINTIIDKDIEGITEFTSHARAINGLTTANPGSIDTEYTYIQSIDLPDIFDMLSKITGIGILPENITTFTDNIVSPIDSTKKIFINKKYFYYDYNILNSIKDILSEILRYDPTSSRKQQSLRNDYLYYESKKFFTNIKDIIGSFESYTDLNVITTLLQSVIDTPYGDISDPNNFKPNNDTYNKTLQDAFKELIIKIPETGGSGFVDTSTTYSTVLTEEIREKIQENINSKLLSEFIILSSKIYNINEEIFGLDEIKLSDYIHQLREEAMSEEHNNNILLYMSEFINNLSTFFNNLFDDIDPQSIINMFRSNIRHGYTGKDNIATHIYLYIKICFLFGIMINNNNGIRQSADFIPITNADIANTVTDEVINTKFLTKIFEVFKQNFNYKDNLTTFDTLFNTFIDNLSRRGLSDNRDEMIFMLRYSYKTNNLPDLKYILLYFSVINKFFIDNIKLLPGNDKENGYYKNIINLDEITHMPEGHRRVLQDFKNLTRTKKLITSTKTDTLFENNLLVYKNVIDIILGLSSFVTELGTDTPNTSRRVAETETIFEQPHRTPLQSEGEAQAEAATAESYSGLTIYEIKEELNRKNIAFGSKDTKKILLHKLINSSDVPPPPPVSKSRRKMSVAPPPPSLSDSLRETSVAPPPPQRQTSEESDNQCNCKTKQGKRCTKPKKPDSHYCIIHEHCSDKFKGGSHTKKHYQISHIFTKRITQRKRISNKKYTKKNQIKHNKTIRKTKKY